MRKALFLLSLIAFIFSLAVGQADAEKNTGEKLSARLRAQIAAKKDYVAKPSSEKFKALKSLGLQEADSQIVFLHSKTKLSNRSLRSLKRLGVEVNEGSWIPPVGGQTVHTTGFVSAKIPIKGNKIGKVAKKSFIERIETAEQSLMPLNDLAAEDIQAVPVWNLGNKGTGVKIAILDSGLDTSHSDMPTPLVAEDYSNYPPLDYDVDNKITSHGTHVTGSVLGRGTQSNGKYKGIAPTADLIFLKIGNDSDSGASFSAIVAAIKAAVKYGADIINISYGGFDPYKDGSDEICQAVDYAKAQGVIVFAAAGNEAARQKHYSGTAGAHSETDYIKIDVGGYIFLDLNWFDGLGVSNDLSIKLYGKDKVEVSTFSFRDSESARGTELEVLSAFVDENGTYYLKIENNSDSDQFFHIYSMNYWVTFDDADPCYTIQTPAIADGAVAVASHTTRTSWTNYLGDVYDFGGIIGDISSFSSRGPRIDGLEKPQLAAPGESIISPRDKIQVLGGADYLIIDDDGINDGKGPANYLVLQGTSMSCPVAAGGAALLMQANPSFKSNPDDLLNLMQKTASNGGLHNNTWGYGKINLLAALNAIPTPTPTPTPEITPLPSPTEISTPTPTPSPDITPIPSPDPTGTSIPSPIPAITPTPLPSPTETSSPEPIPTSPSIPTPVPSPEITPVIPTPSPTPKETPTLEPLPTPTPIVGGGGGDEPFTEGFQVESTNPKDGATDVKIDGKIEVTIEVKYNQSINGDPLALDRNGSEVEFRAEGTEVNLPVTLEPRNRDLIIKPSEPLEKGKTYTLKIFRWAIKAANAGGTQMENDFAMKFTTKN